MKLLDLLFDRGTNRSRAQTGKNAGIAKILCGDGPDHAGMGILVTSRHILTCAHVVNVALEREDAAAARVPREKVTVSFPMLGQKHYRAEIEAWCAPGEEPENDIAVLRLDEEAPADVGFAIFANLTGTLPDGDRLNVFGLGEGLRLGNHIEAEFVGPTSAAWVQIDGADDKGAFVEGGFSGAAVFDKPHAAVLGMMVAKKFSEVQHTAYMIPTADLKAFWPGLPVENRPLSPTFARTWTIYSTFFFLVLLLHWLVDRGVLSVAPFTLSGTNKELAAFWGMHLYGFLAPPLLLMLIAFARSFRLHPWPARVPSFGSFTRYPLSSVTWRGAALSLFLFVILPLAAQIHFTRQFYDNGNVYIYPDSFGFKVGDAELGKCSGGSIRMCIKSDAGRFSLAAPKPGARGSYWDNAYHYGHRVEDKDEGTVTFFPILQPSVLLLLTAISAVLAVIAMYLVLRAVRTVQDKPGRLTKQAQIEASAPDGPIEATATPDRHGR